PLVQSVPSPPHLSCLLPVVLLEVRLQKVPRRQGVSVPQLSCRLFFHIGEKPPPSCPECLSGVLVCPAHQVSCGARASFSCHQCLRVLCQKHQDCFCSESELKRDEEKNSRNKGSKVRSPPSLSLSYSSHSTNSSPQPSYAFQSKRMRASSSS